MKVCQRCSISKPASEFQKHRKYKDGLGPWCKGCVSSWQKARRQDNPVLVRSQARKRYHTGCSRGRTWAYRKRTKRTPKDARYHARRILRNAMRRGEIERWGQCERCGTGRTEGHHADYSRPLDVEWLCRRCHAELHRKAT